MEGFRIEFRVRRLFDMYMEFERIFLTTLLTLTSTVIVTLTLTDCNINQP